jgi:hypothetical protein
VELFEEIRREYEFGVGTIKGVARKLKVHRRMVREAIGNALPRPRKKIEQRRGKLTAYMPLIDRMLEDDRRAPRKQRHTAHRIWERLRAEVPGFDVCERSVRKYVERRRQELGLAAREICVPQSYEWGAEAQVDFHEPPLTVKGFLSAQRAAVVLLTFVYDPTSIRIPEGHKLAGCTMGSDNVSRCCQLVHGFGRPNRPSQSPGRRSYCTTQRRQTRHLQVMKPAHQGMV